MLLSTANVKKNQSHTFHPFPQKYVFKGKKKNIKCYLFNEPI